MSSRRSGESGTERPWTSAVGILSAFLLGACAAPMQPSGGSPSSWALTTPEVWREARMVDAGSPLECVAYARQVSGIEIRGDAWTWWNKSRGRYDRGARPRPGAVLVFRRNGRSTGHLAVVNRVVNDRVIVVDHANWLNDGRVYERTPVRDVSPHGDWSAVRVWYTPGQVWGRRAYRTYGFIHARPLLAADG